MQINENDLDKVWNPELKFRKMVHSEILPKVGKVLNFDMWFDGNTNEMDYYQDIKLEIACNFNFEDYPFDKHNCDIDFGTPSQEMGKEMKFDQLHVLNKSAIIKLTENRPLHNDHLPYVFYVTAKREYSWYRDEYMYPVIGFTIHVKRRSFGLLIGAFYIPTAIFALLSLVSYFIDPEVVSIFLTEWIFLQFYAIQILREINLGKIQRP